MLLPESSVQKILDTNNMTSVRLKTGEKIYSLKNTAIVSDERLFGASHLIISVTKLLSDVSDTSDDDTPNILFDPFQNLIVYILFNWVPEYFYTMPASSTGKYHPAFANRKDGLMLHSLAVARYTVSLLELFDGFNTDEKKTMIIAALFHDMFKYGDPEKFDPRNPTLHEHPVYAAEFFRYEQTKKIISNIGIDPVISDRIADLIETHSGPYVTSKHSDIVLKQPETLAQKIIFKADYYASRKENEIVSDYLNHK